MEVLGKKADRLLKANVISLVLMFVIALLIGIFAPNKMLTILPSCIGVVNLVMIVMYYKTPNDMIVRDGDKLIIKGAFGKDESIDIASINSCIYSCYNAKSKDGVLCIEVNGEKKPRMIQAVKDVDKVREAVFNARKEYSFDATYDIENKEANSKNSDTSNEFSADNNLKEEDNTSVVLDAETDNDTKVDCREDTGEKEVSHASDESDEVTF